MREEEKVQAKVIRSELTHEQEVSLTHSPLSWEVVERIQANLKALDERSKTPRKE
jgi:hypothetical protein